jgi:SAM-dependent methyltransferase
MATLSNSATFEPWLERSSFYEQRVSSRIREGNRFYHRLLREHYSFLVPAGARALELGCGLGDLLAAVRPTRGVGMDFSAKAIALARQRHPEFEFQVGDASALPVSEKFDYILLSDLINDLPDVQRVFERLQAAAHPDTRLVLNFLNTMWRPLLALAELLGAKAPSPPQNWLSTDDVANLLHLAGWETVKVEHRIIWPVNTPFLAKLLNRWLAPILPDFCLTIFIVARPIRRCAIPPHYTCSVIIPARNEAGNLDAAAQRTPEMGLGSELIFVEGHSTDDTWDRLQRVAAAYPERKIKVLRQKGKGKGDAVRAGFAAASGDILFILDADLTVAPEELPKFYEIIRAGTAEFVNGVRLVYPMQHEAMRFLNMIANKSFGLAFSWLLGQKTKDTLCGTKVLQRRNYESIARNRSYFGEFDPFGDFDLLFGAAKLNLRIADVPIRYCARTYGETNIKRWQHGWLLLRMVAVAARKLKFR